MGMEKLQPCKYKLNEKNERADIEYTSVLDHFYERQTEQKVVKNLAQIKSDSEIQ